MVGTGRGTRRAALAVLAATSLALAACSTGSSNSSSSSGGSADVSAAVTDNVAKYMAQPTFTAPGPAIDISGVKGKSMFLIPLVPNPFNQSIQETMQRIATRAGMKFTIYPNQGQASQWVQGMNAALTAKPDIIVLSTAPGSARPPAAAAGGQGGRDPGAGHPLLRRLLARSPRPARAARPASRRW